MEDYLKLFKKEISYDHYHQWSGLDFLIASSNWMKNFQDIVKRKNEDWRTHENKLKYKNENRKQNSIST